MISWIFWNFEVPPPGMSLQAARPYGKPQNFYNPGPQQTSILKFKPQYWRLSSRIVKIQVFNFSIRKSRIVNFTIFDKFNIEEKLKRFKFSNPIPIIVPQICFIIFFFIDWIIFFIDCVFFIDCILFRLITYFKIISKVINIQIHSKIHKLGPMGPHGPPPGPTAP